MKISFNFDESAKSIILTPSNDLENLLMTEIEKQCTKGAGLRISKIEKDEMSHCYVIELRTNGH